MRRYLDIENIYYNGKSFDVIIVGAGIAGLYGALNLNSDFSCCLITKESIDISNSWLAQGGIAAAISEEDLPEYHFNDTIKAGGGLINKEAVRILVEEGPEDIKRLQRWNVPFDLDEEGDLKITREGGHRRRRIVHAHGDGAGRETIKALARLVAKKENITFMPNTFLFDIIIDKNEAKGVIIGDDNKKEFINGSQVILCTGGSGQIYSHTTNPGIATGDGLGAALRAGVKLNDMEFVQFHPTGLYIENNKGRSFLISEAIRGEGGILKNHSGEAFMDKKHELKDLAPRDIVARYILEEMAKFKSKYVYLDITKKSKEYLSKRFPTIYGECLNQGFDMSRDLIPVCPVQHYMMGGIKTDLYGRTNIKGIYACGEVANTGVHGANRLASNSILECLVFSRRSSLYINNLNKKEKDDFKFKVWSKEYDKKYLDINKGKNLIKELMTKNAGMVRKKKNMENALLKLEKLGDKLEKSSIKTKEKAELYNMCFVGIEILKGALKRKKNIGAHYRED